MINGIAGDLYTGDKGSFANPDLAGNLGGGVLRRFTVTSDYAHQVMYLQPNVEFGKPDAFDRSGLWLFGEGKVLKIVAVAEHSAAARARLRVGDEITSIDHVSVAAKSLSDWRALLRERPAGTTLRVAYRRHGKPGVLSLVLADRIPAAH
jgi:C-terminal processing protease CtpA/Prc